LGCSPSATMTCASLRGPCEPNCNCYIFSSHQCNRGQR
jgi:hypothetical protein